jgi:signal transduction histidine kinase
VVAGHADTGVAAEVPPGSPAVTRHRPETPPRRRGRRPLAGRGWDVTAILVSWFGGLVLLGEAAELRDLSEEALFLHFVAGCVLSLTLWWRRSHPMAVALFLAAVSVVADGAGVAGLIGLYTVVSLRRGRPVVVIVLVNLLGGFVYGLIYPDMTEPRVVNVVLTIALLAATVATGVAARSRRELIESLRERAARAEEEARLRTDRLRALERERIAREMHDALAHRISMVSLHAGALQIRPDLTPEEVAKAAATIRDSAHHALEDLREILGVLRAGPDDALRPQPGLQHLEELVTQARNVAGIRVTTTDHLEGRPVSPSLGRTVYRLVQEGLTNAGKHAPGSPVSVLLERTPDGDLHVRVSNPLSPPPQSPPVGDRAFPNRVVPGREVLDRASSDGVDVEAVVSGRTVSDGVDVGGVVPGLAVSGAEDAGGPVHGGPVRADMGRARAVRVDIGRAEGGRADVGRLEAARARAVRAVAGRSGAGSVVPGAGSGLIGLAERVELLDGRLRHGVHGDPRAGLTFDLEAWLPWPTPSGS